MKGEREMREFEIPIIESIQLQGIRFAAEARSGMGNCKVTY